MDRGDRTSQSGFRAFAVPRPQGTHGFPARFLSLVVQCMTEQAVDAGRQFALCGGAVFDQQLQGAGPNRPGLGA